MTPTTGELGALDVAARITGIRLTDRTAFDAGLADPTKSARRATSIGVGLDWLPNPSLRLVVDLDRTSFRGGAKTGDRPSETSITARMQTVF